MFKIHSISHSTRRDKGSKRKSNYEPECQQKHGAKLRSDLRNNCLPAFSRKSQLHKHSPRTILLFAVTCLRDNTMKDYLLNQIFHNMDETASILRISRRTLQGLINSKPYYSLMGKRRKVFSLKDIAKLHEAMSCHSDSSNVTVNGTGISAGQSEELLLIKHAH
jgi:hypothetical protein